MNIYFVRLEFDSYEIFTHFLRFGNVSRYIFEEILLDKKYHKTFVI
jgi:hypothetical protein